jgi:hypothetical protein
MAAANMMQCSWHSVMTRKDVLECFLDSSEIVQEFFDKSLLKRFENKGIAVIVVSLSDSLYFFTST